MIPAENMFFVALLLPKTNIDTRNDGLEKVSPSSNMASFWVSLLNFFWGVVGYIERAKGAAKNLRVIFLLTENLDR